MAFNDSSLPPVLPEDAAPLMATVAGSVLLPGDAGSPERSPEGRLAIANLDHCHASGSRSNVVSTATIRHALRALACETDRRAGLRGVKLLRPLVAQAHKALRERLEAGGSVEDNLRGRARLADSAVVGLLHLASASTGMRGGSMIAPLAAVAVGGYGRRELAPGSDLDLLFLLPEGSHSGSTGATAACVNAVVAGLWDLGFVLDHATRSSRDSLDLAQSEPAVLAGLLDRRFLWGGYGLFAALDADLARLFSGPDAARWRRAVDSAVGNTRRDALRGAQTLDDEPDVKRGSGGLRDLQRIRAASILASGRATALAEPTLLDAHRFLWLARCNLHLLVGRAEDRLTTELQADVARLLGFGGSPRPAACLLHHFRGHAHNVVQAAALGAASVPA
jgi:UTP:GlnB (protein PII) uridylyltransferase